MSSSDSSNRLSSYKNLGRKDENRGESPVRPSVLGVSMHAAYLRCSGVTADKRFEGSVELRKQARSEQLQKRRHVVEEEHEDDAEDDLNVLGDLQAPKENAATLANLPNMVAGMKGVDPLLRYQSTKQCRILLSKEKNAPIAQVLDTGILPLLVQFLANEADPSLQLEACWVLTNIASGTSAQTHAVVHAGSLPYLIKMLSSASEELREQA
jgi:importin subunit alpha-1